MQLDYNYFTTNNCKIAKSMVQTNPRYKNFTQLYYTVGDPQQFWVANNEAKLYFHPTFKNADYSSNRLNRLEEPRDKISLQENIFKDIETFIPFEGYKNVSEAEIENTFNYMFHKFKKGIFIKIRNGELAAFVPFSKAVYVNEWSHLIKIDPKYGASSSSAVENFFKTHHDITNKLNQTYYKFNPNKINFDPGFWYANNCILRYENPINEGENNYAQLKSMFLELCAERQIPDMDFFINRRDFPLLTRNNTEPYNNIYGDNIPLQSYKFEKYIPILSMCSSDKFADVAIPTHEDWARVKSKEGVFFPQKCRNYNFTFNLKWETKKNLAVFRGSNTGCGYNLTNNTRLKLANLGTQHPQFLDVGITNWNLRIRKNKNSEYLQIPDVGNLKLANKLTPEEQSNYKYLINVDGHVSAFRLSLELSMGCCILLVNSNEKWKMWFSNMLEPYVHYIPVKSNLTDLIDQIQWCKKNDYECKKIAKNALNFYNKYLTKKGILDNLQKTLFKLNDEMYFVKNIEDPLLIQSNAEYKVLTIDRPDTYKLTGLFPKNIGRNYGTLKGLENFVKQSVKPEDQITLVGVEVKIIFKSKTTKVVLYQIGSQYVVGKKTIDPMKKIEFIHEAFIGKYAINNLLKKCPNFVFNLAYRDEPYITYGPQEYLPSFDERRDYSLKETTVMQEYIQGPTLQEFLRKSSMKAYLEILFSISCALMIAQTNYGFVHHDLKPWNIVVNVLPEPIVLDYYIKNDINYKIKTKYIPVIIDYGKSHIIHNNLHYGIIDPFNINKSIDLITLLVSTLNELVQQKENVMDINDLIYIANFLSLKKIVNIQELRMFLYKAKKTTSLENLPNSNLFTSKTFEEFFKHTTPLTHKYKIGFGKDKITLSTWSSNPRQIVDMGFGLDLEDKVNSYIDVARRIYKNPMPQATNRFTTIMIAQKMSEGLLIPKMEFVEFAAKQNLNKKIIDEVIKEFNKIEKFIMDFYTIQLNKKTRKLFNLQIDQKTYKTVVNFNVKPSRSLFLSSDKTKHELLQNMADLPVSFPPYYYYRNMILDVLKNRGPFRINDDDKQFYMDNFKLVFDDTYLSKATDIETIRHYLK